MPHALRRAHATLVLLLATSTTAGCARRVAPRAATAATAQLCRADERVVARNEEGYALRIVLWTDAAPGTRGQGAYTSAPLRDLAVLAAGQTDTLPPLRAGERLEAKAADGEGMRGRLPAVRYGCAAPVPGAAGA